MKDIAKRLNEAFYEGIYDPMDEDTLQDTYDYIDPSELGGCCGGHWADENMIPMEDEDYEKDEI